MMGYKVYWAILLWHLGLRRVLPSTYVNRKRIRDNHSPLVDISKDEEFSFDERALQRGGLWVRRDLVLMLKMASCRLPKGVKLHFYTGWRHMAVQWKNWEQSLLQKRMEYPDADEEELKRLARLTSADPSRGGFGPHQTGGAVDLTLVKNGKPLDMGTPFGHQGVESQTDYKGINEQQRQNRNTLREVMQVAGFINYPGEWWHYSYGDRAWAAYARKKFAIYGKINNPDYQLKPEEQKKFK